MATSEKNLSDNKLKGLPDLSNKVFGIVVSEWNEDITSLLANGCRKTLLANNIKEGNIHEVRVPGSFELPLGARILASREKLDAVICLGCVIKGETKHDEYINNAVAQGIMNLGLTSGKPIVFGVLTPNDKQQALDRAGGKHGNKGDEAAATALKMVALKTTMGEQQSSIGFNKKTL